MTELPMMSATEMVAAYRAKTVSPVEVTRAVLDRIGALNGTFNAFCVIDEERSLAEARASEERWQRGQPAGPVDGVPATIKDLMLSKGWPTRSGSRTTPAEGEWTEDTACVARLRESGVPWLTLFELLRPSPAFEA